MRTSDEILKASQLLKAGGLVAFPTETVYGLGCDARNEAAIKKVFIAKERPYSHPLIVHVAEFEQLSDWASVIPPEAYLLAEAFWPGPLTLILPKKKEVSALVSGNQDSIGLRIPKHPVAMALLREFGGGIAAPSANKFTHVSPTTALAVEEELGKEVDLILPGGDCEVGLESTIVDLSSETPAILRPGMISQAAIEAIIGPVSMMPHNPKVHVPGSHHLHYAPQTKTLLLNRDEIESVLKTAIGRTVILFFNYNDNTDKFTLDFSSYPSVVTHKMPRTPDAYARVLYKTLRELDYEGFAQIIIETVPNTAEWDAIRDRIQKASGRK